MLDLMKKHPENIAFLNLKILELFNSKLSYFLTYYIVSACL